MALIGNCLLRGILRKNLHSQLRLQVNPIQITVSLLSFVRIECKQLRCELNLKI